jgi:hypothetical protein
MPSDLTLMDYFTIIPIIIIEYINNRGKELFQQHKFWNKLIGFRGRYGGKNKTGPD